MRDLILDHVFDPRLGANERWDEAQRVGYDKGIPIPIVADACSWEVRLEKYYAIQEGRYDIGIPHIAFIPKDDGTQREVYVNDGFDRILLRVINQVLFELCGKKLIHPDCMSYKQNISCGDVAEQIAHTVSNAYGQIGVKSDIHHYFDEVRIEYIEKVWDDIERITGPSAILDLLRRYYRDDRYYGRRDQKTGKRPLLHRYQSLRQGCAVSAFLADAVLKPLDEKLSGMLDIYKRYSDDQILIGNRWPEGLQVMRDYYAAMGLEVHPKKLQAVERSKFVKFLGFCIRGEQITISESQLRRFTTEVEHTMKGHRNRKGKWVYPTVKQMVTTINRLLYNPGGEYSMATRLFRVINCQHDLDILDQWIKDVIRNVACGHYKMADVGGIGYIPSGLHGCLERPHNAKRVTLNRNNTPRIIQRYRSITYMQSLLRTNRAAFDCEVRALLRGE